MNTAALMDELNKAVLTHHRPDEGNLETIITAFLLTHLQAQHERTREQAAQLAEQDAMLDWSWGTFGHAKGTARRIAASLRTLPWETP